MNISIEDLRNSYLWQEYFQLHEQLVNQGKTTGTLQNEAMAHYTMLNFQRSKRIFNHIKFNDNQLERINSAQAQNWLLITEAWCGDAAQSVPVIAKIAALNENIKLKIVLRDEHPELIDSFLTNGGRSVPILVFSKPEDGIVLKHWGPRPEKAQKLFYEHKAKNTSKEDAILDLQKWYNDNKSQDIIEEIISAMH
jgi:hypothetical protein